MSDAMVFVLDALDDPRALQGIRDEVLEMDLAVKRHMDRGLTPDEWAVAQAVRSITVYHSIAFLLNQNKLVAAIANNSLIAHFLWHRWRCCYQHAAEKQHGEYCK